MSIHDENNATVYKCKNCNKYYTDHFSRESIEEHISGKCKSEDIIVKDFSFTPNTGLSWAEYFIRMAYLVSHKSKDLSSKIGSVLTRDNMVLSCGFNGIPKGCNDNAEYRNERPEKYYFYEHSERNCLYFAARNGINTNNSVLYTLAVPCSDCARGLIQAGVSKVYYHYQHNANFEFENPKWAESVKRSLEMFDESGVKCIGHNQWFGFSTLINGKNIEV